MKVFGYVRVSTERQANEGISLEAQSARITAWAHAMGHDLAGVYTDAGLSGGRADNRPELARCLNDVCAAKGILVVYSLTRLARSTSDTISIAERLNHSGAELVSLSESIDTSSAAGKMMFRLLAVLGEFERDLVAERTRTALAHKRAKGEKTGGVVPYGFRMVDGLLVEDDAEQGAIHLMRQLRAQGHSYRSIASELTARAIPTKTGASWSQVVVREILIREEAA